MAKGNHLNAASTEMALDRTEDFEFERSAEEIRQDIAAKRESITETVDRLSDRFQETFDWRTYVTRHPFAAVGVAAGLGVLVSGIFKPRPTPMERIQDAFADGFEEFSGQIRSQLTGMVVKPAVTQTVKAAATGFLVKAAAEYLRSRYLGEGSEAPQESARRPDFHTPRTAPID
jgi:ElaB/YqjD/DUF883 family membrane-anchored ribosome-binding protein